jgi:hypothetical protein
MLNRGKFYESFSLFIILFHPSAVKILLEEGLEGAGRGAEGAGLEGAADLILF